MQLRTTLNGFQPTEAEFRTLFAIQQAFDEEYPVNSPNADPNVRLARTQATPRLRQQIAEALSPARRAEFEAAQQ